MWRGRGLVLVIVVSLLAVAGVGFIVAGLHEDPPAAAPLPSSTFSLAGPALAGARQAAQASATASHAPRFDRPDTVYIPALGVAAPVVPEGMTGASLDIPGDPRTVGLATHYAPLPATDGTTLMAGHVNYNGTPGALAQLAELKPGSLVAVTDAKGRPTLWAVTGMTVRDKSDFPSLSVTGPRELLLVTCGGPVFFDGTAWHYRDNVIVTAVPA